MWISESISIQDFGSKIAVGISGKDKTAVEQRFFSFWNHGATNGEFEWTDDISGYFWSTKADLHKSLVNAALFNLLNTNPLEFKGKKYGALPKARKIAAALFNSLTKKEIVKIKEIDNDFFKIHVSLDNI